MVNYKRVNKPTARKMYNIGSSILLLPCKVSDKVLDNTHPWIKPVEISILTSENEENQFDRSVNSYEYYNCNSELGYYAQYYVSLEDLEMYSMCRLMC